MCLLDLNLSQLYSHIFWYYNFPGESDDDREELLVAANAAHNARSMPLDFIFYFFPFLILSILQKSSNFIIICTYYKI